MATKTIGIAGLLVLALAVGLLALLGGDDETKATETDGAFVAEMVPHHESAIEMAEVALKRAEHPEIRDLAQNIIATQSDEIGTLEMIHQRLFGEPVGAGDHGTLGLPPDQMGMEMDAATLATADPFDREFIDMMIPHHQGAIRMAYVELENGGDDEAMALAETIIDAQAAEIEDMSAWRADWYGAPSPAGGVPDVGDTAAPSHEEMGH